MNESKWPVPFKFLMIPVTRYNIRQCDMAVVENNKRQLPQLNRQTYPFQLISKKMKQINTPLDINCTCKTHQLEFFELKMMYSRQAVQVLLRTYAAALLK